jgi:hypothetical protein
MGGRPVVTVCLGRPEVPALFEFPISPHNATRRGLTRLFSTGPVVSHAAPTRPPQPPEHRMRRSTSPKTICAP